MVLSHTVSTAISRRRHVGLSRGNVYPPKRVATPPFGVGGPSGVARDQARVLGDPGPGQPLARAHLLHSRSFARNRSHNHIERPHACQVRPSRPGGCPGGSTTEHRGSSGTPRSAPAGHVTVHV